MPRFDPDEREAVETALANALAAFDARPPRDRDPREGRAIRGALGKILGIAPFPPLGKHLRLLDVRDGNARAPEVYWHHDAGLLAFCHQLHPLTDREARGEFTVPLRAPDARTRPPRAGRRGEPAAKEAHV